MPLSNCNHPGFLSGLTAPALASILFLAGCGQPPFAPDSVAVPKDPPGGTVAAVPGDPVSALPPEDTRPTTHRLITTLAGTGLNGLGADGSPPLQTDFSLPQDLAFGPDGKPYLLDWNNHRVVTISGGLVETVIGTGLLGDAPDTLAVECNLNHPTHISFDPQGRLILSAWHNSKLMRLDMTTGFLSAICGNGNRAFSGDGGLAIDAELNLPVATAFAGNGDMYVTDEANVRIRRIDGTTGIIDTFAGQGPPGGYSGDGGPAAQAQINLPFGQSALPVGRLCIHGNTLYFADCYSHIVRAIDLSTTIITTVAGTPGVYGYAGDGGPATAALLSGPADVDTDAEGNLYIADTFNHLVRRVDAGTGVITTFAGRYVEDPSTGLAIGGYDGDNGPPTAAWMNRPYGICFDDSDNFYIADTHNYRFRVIYK